MQKAHGYKPMVVVELEAETFSTGWVNTDGTTDVENGAKMTFNHNLGTPDILVEVWVADDASGTNNQRLNYSGHDTGATIRYGAAVHGATNDTIGVVLGSYGYIDEQGDLSQAPTGVHQFTDKYIKVVISSGAGSGPRAYVAFDGTASNMTDELNASNSFNVSSITDNGAGDYTINYTNPVSQPIITIGYEVRASSPFHALYWGIIDQTDSYARIGLGSNNVYYDHPYVSFIAH